MKHSMLFTGWIICLASMGQLARTNDIPINLINQDKYAIRIMKVITKSGTDPRGTELSFDPATMLFVVKGGTGEKSVSAIDIARIEFSQELKKMSPMAQTTPWTIMVTPGRLATYKIPDQMFKIEAGKLSLQPSWEQGNRGTPAAAATRTPAVASNGTVDEILEPIALSYDKAGKTFELKMQYKVYSQVFSGGGGNGVTGTSKPGQ